MRDRILNLPLMVAAVLTLIWRDVAGVTELTRMLNRKGETRQGKAQERTFRSPLTAEPATY
jgi:hypothetical protein